MVDAALFSSDKMDWETPPDFFARLDAEFKFTLDACANEYNAKCERYYSVEDDARFLHWPGVAWCNPPYGREIGDWVRKAYLESLDGSTVVMLIPARTDTAYWHNYVMLAHEIRFVRGRLRFVGGDSCAPFPSAVVVFRPGHSGGPTISTMEAREMEMTLA